MQGRIPLGVGAIVSPQAAAAQRGMVCLSTTATAVWGMTQHQDIGGYSLNSLTKASVPHLSSSIFSPLCLIPAFSRAQGKWLQMKIYALAL